MTPALESRLRQYRRRALVRSREYRQRDDAHGVWFRLRRALAQASAASAPADRVTQLSSARSVAVRVSAARLSAECLARAPFESRAARTGGT